MKHLDIFTQPACQPCRMTKKIASELGVNFTEYNAADFLEEFERLDADKVAPLVVAYIDDEQDSWWSGFRPDRIKEYA